MFSASRARQTLAAWIGALLLLVAASAAIAADWEYARAITNPGTRSEGFTGTLRYRGVVVSSKLHAVVTPDGAWEFVSSSVPWGAHGWSPVDPARILRPSAGPTTPADSEGKHWYRGARREGTPPGWCHAPVHDHWFDPRHLEAFVAAVLKDVPALPASPFAGLLSGDADVGTTPKERDDSAVTGAAGAHQKDLGGFAYAREMANAGSRSAGERGSLTFDGAPLRGYPGRQLRTPIGSFHYVESDRLWEPQGWFPMSDIAVTSTESTIPMDALLAGQYRGARRLGTPEKWCYDLGADTWLEPGQLAIKAPNPVPQRPSR